MRAVTLMSYCAGIVRGDLQACNGDESSERMQTRRTLENEKAWEWRTLTRMLGMKSGSFRSLSLMAQQLSAEPGIEVLNMRDVYICPGNSSVH